MVKLNMTVVGQPPLSAADVIPGLLCCASSSIDKRWYRAVVISAHDVSGAVSLCVGRGRRVWEGEGRYGCVWEEGGMCLEWWVCVWGEREGGCVCGRREGKYRCMGVCEEGGRDASGVVSL